MSSIRFGGNRQFFFQDQDSSVPRAYNVPGRYVPRKRFGSNDFLDWIGWFFPVNSCNKVLEMTDTSWFHDFHDMFFWIKMKCWHCFGGIRMWDGFFCGEASHDQKHDECGRTQKCLGRMCMVTRQQHVDSAWWFSKQGTIKTTLFFTITNVPNFKSLSGHLAPCRTWSKPPPLCWCWDKNKWMDHHLEIHGLHDVCYSW